jgi:hypothetical protein
MAGLAGFKLYYQQSLDNYHCGCPGTLDLFYGSNFDLGLKKKVK